MNEERTPGALGSHAGLGPLPEPAFPIPREGDLQTAPWEVDCYTAEQMRAYAAQERAAERERCKRIVQLNQYRNGHHTHEGQRWATTTCG